MTKLLLSIHVIAAILAVGPVAVAASRFPAATRRALAGDDRAVSELRTLHRICRIYAVLGVAVPAFGFATAQSLGVLGDIWLIISIALTACAAGVLALLVLPGQQRTLAAVTASDADPKAPAQLAMHAGIFNLLWATVTVLMIVRPGSTTGV
ncbi:hypothetical protein Kfla_5798 [Kribbella flavida DSM 17836]|uniref:Integral membrane protein n=1 Tax=Kribbella flavida (strain DSM 17836 / JCM 10339 / NBRC 14399) TaxID=479435 RepID=D2PQA0_KRIFD|nr:membrane protein [Kribbella flavida]ADB34802.1 hypothetical protein Kfla_5798 [Kribbella flavida DSM 17836]